MTAKRYSVEGNWIKDNWIDNLLNIDFNTIDDAILCCDLLNNTEDKKLENGELATQLLKENGQLKQFQEKVFDLINEKIKHYEHKPISTPVGQPMSVNFDADMDRLARLSELLHLKEVLEE